MPMLILLGLLLLRNRGEDRHLFGARAAVVITTPYGDVRWTMLFTGVNISASLVQGR